MKKYTIPIIILVFAIALSSGYYLYSINSRKKTGMQDKDSTQAIVPEGEKTETVSQDIGFGEYIYEISSTEKIWARYLKSGQATRIYSLNPISDKYRYDISSSGYVAVYLSNDNDIWLLYNDGTKKKLSPDSFGGINKSDVLKSNPGYIWAYGPEFTARNSVRFISNLPDTGPYPLKSIWEINIDDNAMKKMYTPASANYRLLGDRLDGRLIILDENSLNAVDAANGAVENINVEDKNIISLSPGGDTIIYGKKDKNGQKNNRNLMAMDCYGNNTRSIPLKEDYIFTEIGAWSDDNSRYAFIMKSTDGSDFRVAVAEFFEGTVSVNDYSIPGISTLPDNSKLGWIDETGVSIDVGENIISVDLQ